MRMGGFKDEDFSKPIITVAAPYTNASSCNHLDLFYLKSFILSTTAGPPFNFLRFIQRPMSIVHASFHQDKAFSFADLGRLRRLRTS